MPRRPVHAKFPALLLLVLSTVLSYPEGVSCGLARSSLIDNVWTLLHDAYANFIKPLITQVTAGVAMYGRSTASTRVSYKNHQLLRVVPLMKDELDKLEALEWEEGVILWGRPMTNRSLDIVVAPYMVDEVKEYLAESGVDYTVLSPNVQKLINEQNPKSNKSDMGELKSINGHTMTWTKYHRYSDIMSYLEYLQSSYPALVDLLTIGKSSEGKSLKVVKISSNRSKKENKPAIWIDGGMHGREWISPAVALYFIKELVEKYEKNRVIVDPIDWYIMPVMNPDGYEFSHGKDRFWRKSRSSLKSDSGRGARFFWSYGDDCKGVDLNRNWDFHWGEKGASDDPCKETFAGSKAFSEPESKAVSDLLMDLKDKMAVYLTLHSYSQMWLVPWSYTQNKVRDYDDLVYMGRKAIEALKKVYGTEYELGTSTSLLYPTSGSSDDWAKGVADIKYSYTVELRDRGIYGFLLPASQIIPTGRETFAAIRTIAKTIIKEYG